MPLMPHGSEHASEDKIYLKSFQQQVRRPSISTELQKVNLKDEYPGGNVPSPGMIFCDPNPFDPDRVSYILINYKPCLNS